MAFASGSPVIASRNCGIILIDGANGFQLQHNTPEEIADLLTTLAAEMFKAAPPFIRPSAVANHVSLPRPDAVGTIRRRRRKSIIRIISISLIFTLATSLSIARWIWYGDWPRTGPSPAVASPALILVLGGEHDLRVRKTLRVAEDFPETPILVTGDGGDIVRRLIENGIDSHRIHIEPKAGNTYANATLSSPWVRDTVGNIVLITSDFHAPRAMAVFQKIFPEHHFTIAYEASDPGQAERTINFRRERAAALYYLVRYRINSFRG